MSDNTASTGDAAGRAVVSDAVLRQDIGDASTVGFAWLLLTDYELQQLAQGIVQPTVQRMAQRTSEDLDAQLRRNAERPVRKARKQA